MGRQKAWKCGSQLLNCLHSSADCVTFDALLTLLLLSSVFCCCEIFQSNKNCSQIHILYIYIFKSARVIFLKALGTRSHVLVCSKSVPKPSSSRFHESTSNNCSTASQIDVRKWQVSIQWPRDDLQISSALAMPTPCNAGFLLSFSFCLPIVIVIAVPHFFLPTLFYCSHFTTVALPQSSIFT